MRERIVGLVDKADYALARAARAVDEPRVRPAAKAVANARLRVSYPDDMSVVALAGGTGSGKSSLFNAICGSDLAVVGGTRPTTDLPMAVASRARSPHMAGYLEMMGIELLQDTCVPDWLCLVDLPDTDSVEVGHRLRVEELLPRLDLIVWVVDPEKYRDLALHDGHLRSLAAWSGQFVFALNQADRLDPPDLEAVKADLTEALAEDGITEATIVACAASPPAGPPLGIDALMDALRVRAIDRTGVYDKLLVDLERAARDLLDATAATGPDFESTAATVLDQAVADMESGDTGAASDRLTALIAGLAGHMGEVAGLKLAKVMAEVPAAVAAAAGRGDPRVALERAVLRPVRDLLQVRAEARAALTDLLLAITALRGA